MAVSGVPTPRANHMRMAAKFALDTVAATARLRSRLPVPFTIRVGLHSGPVMAGVIGTRKFAYDVWGDTVNIAARLEAASQPNRVLASAATVKALGSDYLFEGPHKIDTKEGRMLEVFFVSRHPWRCLISPDHEATYQWHRPDSDMGVTIRQVCRAPATPSRVLVFAITIASLEPGAADETARVHHASRRNGCGVAAGGTGAATGHTGHRIPKHSITRDVRGPVARISPGPKGDRLCRG